MKTVIMTAIFMVGDGIMPVFAYQRLSDSSDNKDAELRKIKKVK